MSSKKTSKKDMSAQVPTKEGKVASRPLSESVTDTEPEVTLTDVVLHLHGTDGEVPRNVNMRGDMFLTPENIATFNKAIKERTAPNPVIFHGKYISCRLKKNGNYQMTSCIRRDTIDKWTDYNGKVNMTDIYRYEMAELQRILILIEKRHTIVRTIENTDQQGEEASRA